MSNSQEQQIVQELKRISRLLALTLIREQTNQTEQVRMLDSYGFKPVEIADLLNTTKNTVYATLSYLRKKAKSEKGKELKRAKVSKPDGEQGT